MAHLSILEQRGVQAEEAGKEGKKAQLLACYCLPPEGRM